MACGGEPRPAPGASAGPEVNPSTVPGRVALELWQLRPGITLASWTAANLTDQVSGADSAVAEVPGGWCARSASAIEVAGRTLVRETFFYPPPMPADPLLPDSGSPELVQLCELAIMRLRVPAGDSLLADSVTSQLDSVFGPRATEARGIGPALWSRSARYQRGGLTIVAAHDRGRGALVLARFPVREALHHEPADSLPLDSAARLAGLDSALWSALERAATDTGAAPPAALITPLTRWVNGAAALPLPRRAAALYVADEVLERSMCRHGLCEQRANAALEPLRAAGSRFTWSPLGGVYTSERAWLTQARILDRDSPIGDRIFLMQLEAGFDFSGTCARGSEGFYAVITNGERYLQRMPEGPISGGVHFLVAEAYRDVVALASGAAGDYADASQYQPEAANARTRALDHYRAAIAAGPSAAASAAWQRSWLLLSGLPPADVRFFCVYD